MRAVRTFSRAGFLLQRRVPTGRLQAIGRRQMGTEIAAGITVGKLAIYGAGVLTGALGMYVAAQSGDSADYNAIRGEIADILDNYDWDDGSLAPLFLRLAWHSSGTFCKNTKSGGSGGATMRFAPECDDDANKGLEHARAFLKPIKDRHPEISNADLWILAGYVAVEEMGGPHIEFTPGRSDASSGASCPPVGRLPDAAQGAQHVRDVFYRMGFDDREIVALVGGGHALGRTHPDRSGYPNRPWTRAPTSFTNEFFRELLENTWKPKKWNGPLVFTDPTQDLIMLPTDMVMKDDPSFRKYTELYAKDDATFQKDFAEAFKKLTELGCNL